MSTAQGISNTRKGMYAFFVETSPGYSQMEHTYFEHEKCGLILIEYLQTGDPHYPIQKNSPFSEMFRVK